MIDWTFLAQPIVIDRLWSGLTMTLFLTVSSAIGGMVVGTLIALVQLARLRFLRHLGRAYVNFFRNTPLLVQLFFWYFGLSILLPARRFPFVHSSWFGPFVASFVIAIVMGAFIAEIVRAGIEAVPYGQAEAGRALGLRNRYVLRLIVLPQLLPIILPGLANEMVNVLKSTSFAMTIGVMDLMGEAQEIEAETFRGFEVMTMISATYLLLSWAIIQGFHVTERLLARPNGERS